MRKTIYKWGQYYLMYSPLWKQITKSSQANRKVFIQSQINSNSSSYKNLKSDREIQKAVIPLVKLQKLAKSSNFNSRLSVAYNILFGSISENKTSSLPQYNDKITTNNVEQQLRAKQFQSDIQKSHAYWNEYKEKIDKAINQFTQSNEKISVKNNSGIEKIVQQLFKLIESSSLSTNAEKNISNQPSNNQNELKKNQNMYQISQLKKRILIQQLLSQISPLSHQKQGQKTQATNTSDFHILQSQQQISNTILVLKIVVKMLRELFTSKISTFEEQEAEDWISVIFNQTDCLKTVTDKLFFYLSHAIYSPQQNLQFTLSQVNDLFIVYQLLNNIIPTLVNLSKGNTIRSSQTSNNHKCDGIIQFISYFDSFAQGKQIQVPKSLFFEIDKVLTFKQTLRKYKQISQEQAQQSQFLKLQKKLQRIQLSQQKKKLQKQYQQKRCSRQFQLWKLNILAQAILRITQLKKSTQLGSQQRQSFMQNYLQSQITSVLQYLSKQIKINKEKNRSKIVQEQLSFSHSITLASLSQFIINFEPNQNKQNRQFKKFKSSISSYLLKLKQSSFKKITNYEFQSKNKLQGQTLYNEIQQMIYLLHRITKDNQIYQIWDCKLQILKQTQFFTKLCKTLHRLIVKEKQYIILSKKDRITLTECIEFFLHQKENRKLFGKDDQQNMTKIFEKVKI